MYDIIIIGAGPAGLTAGIYGALANKKILILEKAWIGGRTAIIHDIKNYPGFSSIDGFTLSENMRKQAVDLGVEIIPQEVKNFDFSSDIKKVETFNGIYESKAVFIAIGASARPLDVENEKRFIGRGVSYCATCDGGFYKDKVVAVVGGGNTSIDDCLYLSNIVKKIYLIHRRDVFTATETALNKVKALADSSDKIEIITNSVVTSLVGKDKLEEVVIKNKITNKEQNIGVDGIFVAIGAKPDTEIFKEVLNLNKNGFIETDVNMRTNIKNVYAIGDVRNTPLRQIVTACGDGAIAVSSFIKDN